MGMFDSVIGKCPTCEVGLVEFQSKVGECILENYELDEVPINIAKDIKGDGGVCTECGEVFNIVPEEDIPETVRMKIL